MDVRKAVKHRENYDSIVTYFKTLKTPGMDQMGKCWQEGIRARRSSLHT